MIAVTLLGIAMVQGKIDPHGNALVYGKAGIDCRLIEDACTLFMQLSRTRKVPAFEVLRTEDPNGHRWFESDLRDPWGHDYVIREEGRPGQVVVISLGPDGIENTDDDISSKTSRLRER